MTRHESRAEAREEALALLYESEITGEPIADTLAHRRVAPGGYACEIAAGVAEHLAEIDELIGRHLRDWRVERMPVVDRVVARLAAYELLYGLDVPTSAVLSEAVSLADRYCGGRSRRFLNGVLAAAATEVRPGSQSPDRSSAAATEEERPGSQSPDRSSAAATEEVRPGSQSPDQSPVAVTEVRPRSQAPAVVIGCETDRETGSVRLVRTREGWLG